MTALRLAIATVGVAALVAGVRAVSHVPVELRHPDGAMLRVALSARPERVERCRTPSEAELADVPQHMRQTVICEGYTAQYQLEVRRNDSLVLSRAVHGGGLRRDRHLYVLEQLPVPPGTSMVEVRLMRMARGGDSIVVDTAATKSDSVQGPTNEDTARQRRREDEVAPSLLLRDSVSFKHGEVVLVTYDRNSRSLRLERGMVQ